MLPGRSYFLKIGTRTTPASITELKHRIDVNSQEKLAAKTLALNEIGFCNLATTLPVAFDPYADNRDTGAFILIDRLTNETAAAGMIAHGLRRATNIHRHGFAVTRESHARAEAPEAGGALVHRALRRRQVDDRQSRREQAARARRPHRACSTATTCATGSTRISASPPPTASRTSAASREVARLMTDAGLIVLTLVHLAVPGRAPARARDRDGGRVHRDLRRHAARRR